MIDMSFKLYVPLLFKLSLTQILKNRNNFKLKTVLKVRMVQNPLLGGDV